MGHLNKKYISTLKSLADGMDFGTMQKHNFDCTECVTSNQRKQISRFPLRQPTFNLEIVYVDLCGPMQQSDFWGHRYFSLIVCGRSKYKWLHLLLKKSDIQSIFRRWKSWAERQYDVKVKLLHTDGGGEFQDTEFQAWLVGEGIEHVTTPPYCPDMNGACEVWNRVIVQTASAMLMTANMPLSFWGQASLCATYLLNRSPSKGLKLKSTPYEELHSQRPYLGHIRTWGCRAYAYVDSTKRKKWDSHSRECLLMGYYESENVFKLYDISANSMIKVRDVIFFEEILGHEKFQRTIKLTPGNDITGTTIASDPEFEVSSEHIPLDDEQQTIMIASLDDLIQRNNSALSADVLHHAFLTRPRLLNFLTQPQLLNFNVPRSYKHAMTSQHADRWKAACDEEYEALIKNGTWDLVQRTPTMTIIQNKWVFDVKVKQKPLTPGPPEIERFKARLVARGDSQVYSINYDEVYAPVVRFVSLRIVLHLAAINDLEIEQGDFCNTFLNGVLNDFEIYMAQPEGYTVKEQPELVCRLKKSIYGLKQGARAWHVCVDEAAVEFGMAKISNDQAIWILIRLILVAHVDDVLIYGDKEHSTGLMKHLASKYKFKDLGPAGLYTGIYIIQDRHHHRLFLDQAPYVSEILEDYKMTNCTPSAIPMDPKATWDQQQDDIPLVGKEIKLYQRAIGQLMYLMLATRPDIAYAVTKLAQFAATPTNRHWAGVLKIMRYLRAHTPVRLCLGSTKPPMLVSPPTNLIGYFDASLMDCTKSRKSIGRSLYLLPTGLLHLLGFQKTRSDCPIFN